MKRMITISLLAGLVGLTACSTPKSEYSVIDTITLEDGLPTNYSIQKVYDEIDFQRACQAYIWGLPMMATDGFVQSFKKDLNGQWGDLMWVKTFEDRSYGITANATTDYFFTWVNLQDTGPIVIDVPAGLTAGFISDIWQRCPADLGVPGLNKGKGGKHLLVGPGQEAPQNTEGYRIIKTETTHNLILTRIIEPNPKKAMELREAFQIYPLAKANNPPKTKIVEIGGRVWKTTQPEGFGYWEGMSRMINSEPVGERDRLIYATLQPLGIEKGKPFNPDARQRKVLEKAAVMGELMAKTTGFITRLESAEYVKGSMWDYPLVVGPTQRGENYDLLDERAAWTYEALGISRGMTSRSVGVGSVYHGQYRSRDGKWLDGSQAYVLRVPKNVPAKNFWTVTVYDNKTRYLIQNGTGYADRGSRSDIVTNEDGSVDIHFGPVAPSGKEKNWIKTNPGEPWFTYFRLYGPLQPYFDRSWVLPDIEKVK